MCVFCRVDAIDSLWALLTKKITAKRKSLKSLQKVASVIEDIQNLHKSLEHLMVTIATYYRFITTSSVVDVLKTLLQL